MTADLHDALLDAHRGEVLGEALFTRLAELQDDGERRQAVLVLQRLETRTKELLAPVLDREGLAPADDAAAAEQGRQVAEAIGSMPWPDLLQAIEGGTGQYVDIYRRLGAAAGDADRPLVDALLAHEVALRAYTSALRSGDGGAADVIFALPHVGPPAG